MPAPRSLSVFFRLVSCLRYLVWIKGAALQPDFMPTHKIVKHPRGPDSELVLRPLNMEKKLFQAPYIGLALLGAYLNIVAFGFQYGLGNHAGQLPVVNWLLNPALYPGDQVLQAYARYPTLHWWAVAFASAWIDTMHVVFVAFIVTKILFFAALARLVRQFLDDYRLVACLIAAIAISPILSGHTPLGYGSTLESVHTHTSLAIALLLWVGCFLVEKRWLAAGIVLGFSIYVNVLCATYTIFAFAGFALLDWHQHKREIWIASVIIGVIALSWLVLSQGAFPGKYSEVYVETLLMQYPFHLTLRSHKVQDFARGLIILAAPACMAIVAAKLRYTKVFRLAWLAGCFLVPVLLGILVGEVFPFPNLVRAQLLRADSFLLLYSLVLIQVCGVGALLSIQMKPTAAALLLVTSAILFPLFLSAPGSAFDFVPIASAFFLLFLVLLVTGHVRHPGAVTLLAGGLTATGVVGFTWIFWMLTGLIALISFFFWAKQLNLGAIATILDPIAITARGLYGDVKNSSSNAPNQAKLASRLCELVLLFTLVGIIPGSSRLWNPIVTPVPAQAAWRDIQLWAKSNTSLDTQFLVPPSPEGFRIFSQRTSWVDWKDGDAIYTLPEYAAEWRRRMNALGIQLVVGKPDVSKWVQQYKEQSWAQLATVARTHNIKYVVQYADVQYEVSSIFRNKYFALYRVDNSGAL